MGEKQNDVAELEQKIKSLNQHIIMLGEKIDILSSEVAIKLVESKMNEAVKEVKQIEQAKEERNMELINMEIVLDNVSYYMEHLEELLLGTPDPLRRAAFFGALFEKAPTYDELIFGTPKLEPCIALSEDFYLSQNQFVSPERLELSTNSLKGCCSAS